MSEIIQQDPYQYFVKDYADGWIPFDTLKEAVKEVKQMGGGLIKIRKRDE